jgi:hypothetical protein
MTAPGWQDHILGTVFPFTHRAANRCEYQGDLKFALPLIPADIAIYKPVG